MRTIKFRGQKISTNEWVYGSLICDKEGNPFAICQQMDNAVHNGILNGWVFGVIPETVGQYINIDDKNEIEIYEGDRVQFSTWKTRITGGVSEVVEIKEGKLLPFYDDEYIQDEQGDPFDMDIGFEIIGNIYENLKN